MSHSSRRARLILTFAACAAWTAGCSGYPAVSSGETVTLIAALRTACSSRSPQRLARALEVIEQRRSKGELADAEYAAFQKIVTMAKEGRWQDAEQETYRFQQAQVR